MAPATPLLAETELVRPQDVAVRWQVSRQHVYDLARSGEVDVVRIGRSVRFVRTSLEDWLARQRIAV